jgi:predicted AAA+ superfamily ATPase
MQKDLIKKLIVEKREFIERVVLTERELKLEKNGNYVFTGLRRAGKTYSLYQTAKDLIAKGLAKERILYIEFEDERLLEFTSADFDLIIEAYREMYDVEPVLFFDEIQNVDGWEKFARRLADSKYRVFITGSNAKMLSSEVAGALGGRFLTKEVYPLSFAEYLTMNKVVITGDAFHGQKRFAIIRLLNEYLHFGGLPELVQFDDKKKWLADLYRKIYYGDIVLRYGIRNERALKLLIKKMAESVMSEISFNRMRHIIESTGSRIGTSTVIDYIGFLKDSYLIYEASNIRARFSGRETNKKYYFADNGVLNLFLDNPDNRLLENIVACDLVRRGHELFFAKEVTEADFVIPDRKTVVQASMSIEGFGTGERETASLIKAAEGTGAENLVIVTMDEERVIREGGYDIKVEPLAKWLLRPETAA